MTNGQRTDFPGHRAGPHERDTGYTDPLGQPAASVGRPAGFP